MQDLWEIAKALMTAFLLGLAKAAGTWVWDNKIAPRLA